MKSFSVSEREEGQRLNRFLEKAVPSLRGALMYRYLRTKRIKLNGKRAEASARVARGDLIELYIDDSFFENTRPSPDFIKASSHLDVVYEDANIAVLNKPSGILVHSSETEFGDTLINRLLRHLHENGEFSPRQSESFTPSLCNRLDRGTSGIVLAAKNTAALGEMNAIIKERLIKKHYLAAVIAKPPADGSYAAYLTKNEGDYIVSVSERARDGAKQIITAFKTLTHKNGLWLLDVDLVTGRTHQIRAHLKFLGCPVLGDGKYGDGKVNKQYRITKQALTACSVTFRLGEQKEKFPVLGYLDGKTFSLKSVWFKDRFF